MYYTECKLFYSYCFSRGRLCELVRRSWRKSINRVRYWVTPYSYPRLQNELSERITGKIRGVLTRNMYQNERNIFIFQLSKRPGRDIIHMKRNKRKLTRDDTLHFRHFTRVTSVTLVGYPTVNIAVVDISRKRQ